MILSSLAFQEIRNLLSHRLEIVLILLTDGVAHALADMVVKQTLDGGLGFYEKGKSDPVVA